MYKRGTPEYDLWKGSPAYELWRERNSAARKGRPRLDLRGRHLSKEHRQKISAALEGRPCSEETRQKISTALMGRSMSDETRLKMSGSNCHFWRGGVSFDPYPVEWTALLRKTIRKRDDYICVLCGKGQTIQCHAVHHIDYDKQNLCPENLITLCTTCHAKTSYNREYWTKLFKITYVPNFLKERMLESESRS